MTTAESGMHPAFASVGAKWRRALARRQELIEGIKAWNVPGHVELANAVFDDEGRRIGILARLTEEPSLLDWAVVASEAVQSFRDALDHAVYAIACVHHQADPPPSDHLLSFPITEDAAKWKKPAKTLAKLLPLPVIDAIVQAQPWSTSDPALRWLADLSNRAKHRSLHLMSLAQPAAQAEVTYVDGIEGLGPWLAPTGPLKVGEWKPIGGVMADVPLPPDMTANIGLNVAHVFHDLDDAKDVGEVFNAVAAEMGRVLNVLQETLRGLT